MSTTLELKVSKPARIHSWKDLLREAEALHADSTDHSYHGSYRSRRYCANVKVHSSGSLDKAIDNLGHIPDEAEEAIREEFTDSEQSELFNQWLSDEAEFLKDWFKGCQHSSADYYDELIAKVQAGEPTNYPAIGAHPTIPAKIRELRKWQKENALFLDAFRAADDGWL